MKVKIKRLSAKSILPTYAKPGDAGMDLTAVSVEYDEENNIIVYKTGLSVEIPEGYVGLIFPRSSIYKVNLTLSNAVGVLDSSYRGEIMFKFRPNLGNFWSPALENYEEFQKDLNRGLFMHYESDNEEHMSLKVYVDVYKLGDRIGQLIILPYPQIEFEEVDELSETERSSGGYGSTGN